MVKTLFKSLFSHRQDEERCFCCLRRFVRVGVTLFVCLMEEEERKLLKLVPYEDVAREIAAEYGREVHFEAFPMPGVACVKCHNSRTYYTTDSMILSVSK